MLPKLREAKYQGDYRIWLKFADGVEGEVDLTNELWGEMFEPLKDTARFAEFVLNKKLRLSGQMAPLLHQNFSIKRCALTTRSSRRQKAARLNSDARLHRNMRRFSLANPDFTIPSISHLELEWAGAAHTALAQQLGFQVQFAEFFKHLLDNLQSVPAEHLDCRPSPLSLSVRAGAIRMYVLLAVSIAEAALAALGEERGLGRRPGELFERPYGGLLKAWENSGEPHPEIQSIWNELQLLKAVRNYVHLPNAASTEQAHWQEILSQERDILRAIDSVIAHLRNMCHVFRN